MEESGRGPQANGREREKKVHRYWETLKTQELFNARPWIRLSVEQVRLPDGRIVDDYYQLQMVDCVIVYAQTEDGRVLMERQYKHGIRKVTLTLPTGGIDPGEEPLKAAQRELLEETGYVSGDWQFLGCFDKMENRGETTISVFVARNVRKVAEPKPSDLEEMEIVLMDTQKLMEGIQSGEISVLNTVSAILLANQSLQSSR